MTTSSERLQAVLVRALAVLRAGDELEALRIVSEHLSVTETLEGGGSPTDGGEGAGRAGTGRTGCVE